MEPQSNFPQSGELLYHPKHHIKIYVWIALVVAAFLGAINGYLYFLRLSYLNQEAITAQQNEQRIQELRAQRSPSTSSGQFEVPSDWKTYRNEEYGFEFKLPVGWIENERTKTPEGDIMINFASPEAQAGPKFDFYGGELNVYIIDNAEALSINDYYDKLWGIGWEKEVLSGIKDIIVDSRNGKLLSNVIGESTVQILVISDHKRIIEIEDASRNSIVNQILFTFKFIDTNGTGILTGQVSIGPNCPVEREGVACTPSPEAYAAREFIVLDSSQKEVARFHADANGSYTVTLSLGTYTIKSAMTGMGYMSNDLPSTITIKAGQTTTLNISIDTGIR